jgi:hypothetical protein
VIVRDFGELTETEAARWQRLYERSGCRIQQSPSYAAALHDSGERVLVALTGDVLAVLTVEENLATMACGDIPVLASGVPTPEQAAAMIRGVRRLTGLSVYAPLVDAPYAAMAALMPTRIWGRSPNSTIDWASDGADMLARARSRGGSQVDRKRRLIERDGLVLDPSGIGITAVREMLDIDDRSWKAAAGQGLRQRGRQAAFYSALVMRGAVTVSFLRHNGTPVAFRIDARVAGRLMCLKWSYDQAYARYSPGVFLLTTGLVAEWSGRGIRTVDLCGGPDRMKELIYSDQSPRIDAWYGDSKMGRDLEEERLTFDARLSAALQEGRGLRHVFG